MRNWKRLLTITAMTLAVLVALVLALGISLTNFLVDFWWFSSLEYGSYFWLRVLYRYIFSGGVTIFFFLIFFLNFWAASRYLGVDQSAFSSLGQESGRQYRKLLQMFQTGSMSVYIPVSLILAVWVASPFYQQWESALLFFFGPDSGVQDPVYREDISFYLFRLPIFELVQKKMLITSSVLVLGIALLYWLEHQLLPVEKRTWPRGAKNHLSGLVLVTALIEAWGFILDRHDLLYTSVHEPSFFGPGFVELRYLLPLIWFVVVSLIAATGSGILWAHTGKGLKSTIGFALVFVVALGLRQSSFLPNLLDRFLVKPNPVKIEKDFMENNIKATLKAYDLEQIKTIPVTAAVGPEMIAPDVRQHLHNIPVWDPEYLDDVYQQLQGIRPYYSFTDVDVARYQINGQTEQVNLAAREINIDKLPDAARNWENLHMRYTHGFGAVITPAAQNGDTPMQWFLRDLNLQSDVGFKVEKPDIYYGTEKLDYAIVPNRLNIPDISSFDMDSSQNYSGKGGVQISSLFRKLLIALYFRDEKLFFSVNIDGNSKALFRRNIVDRIKTLTPYLELDHDPYIVVTPTRVYWVQDAYTTSSWYPVSHDSRFAFAGYQNEEDKRFNYIRNSVKVVVDAFDGTADYYVVDASDPIILGYQNAYPGLFKDVAEMPPLLREQLRYPRDIFQLQMNIYAKYHQTDPALFYQQAETWDFAKVEDKPVRPYYITMIMDGAEEMQNFILLNPMTPIGRNNLSMLGIAGSLKSDNAGRPYSKQIVVYKFSRDVQVDGPSQVSALIDQDPEIARQFALWDQKGSHLKRGRIIMLPIGKAVLYVQPVYIVSTGNTKIPELARVILSMGNVDVMDTSLEKAWEKLEERLRESNLVLHPEPAAPSEIETTPPPEEKRPSVGPMQ
ncbi:MAG: UPF0182 family protein [Methylococcaceae bacterium]|nr:UPF0182 family protein [Methylococcaceae bacterium]